MWCTVRINQPIYAEIAIMNFLLTVSAIIIHSLSIPCPAMCNCMVTPFPDKPSAPERHIKDYGLLSAGDAVVIGVSGGADSVCLLHILCTLREKYALRLAVVHVHHGIRGEEADRDAQFLPVP